VTFVVLLLDRAARHDWINGDTAALLKGLPQIGRCLGTGVLVSCNAQVIDGLPGYVEKFAPLQQIPAFLLYLTGLPNDSVVAGLIWLNELVITMLVGAVIRYAYVRGGHALAVAAGLLAIPGMLIGYTASSFGEPLACAVFVGLVLAGLRRDRASSWLLPMALLATISKDTAALFVLILGVAAIGISGVQGKMLVRAVIRLGIGTASGLLVLAAANEFRSGTLLNHVYLNESRAASGVIASNFFGMLVSPDAGMLWYWPGVALATVILVKVAIRPQPSAAGRRIRMSAAVGLVALLVSVSVLADWWAPFGWFAWGPRLLLPTAAALVPLAVALIDPVSLARTWLSVRTMTVVALISGLALLPNVGIVYHHGADVASVLATWADHPSCQPRPGHDASQADSCLRLETWRLTHVPLLEAVSDAGVDRLYWLDIASGWAAIVLWLVVARRESAPTDRRARHRSSLLRQ